MTRLRAWPARHDKALIGVAVAILVATTLYLIFALSNVTGRQDRADDERSRLAAAEQTRTAQRNALAADVNDLRAQVLRCKDKPADTPGCQTPVAPPPGVTVRAITGPAGPSGPVGSPGLPGEPGRDGASVSAAQVSVAVGRFCAFGQCAKPPTPSQVSSAVVAFCADGACDGKDGVDGKPGDVGQNGDPGVDGRPGSPGADSLVPGPLGPVGIPGVNGPAPTPEQVATAVADYCATRGNCTGLTGPQGPAGADSIVPGPQGPAGVDGAPGAAGRGITSVTCADQRPTVLTFTYTDGTTDAVTCTPPL